MRSHPKTTLTVKIVKVILTWFAHYNIAGFMSKYYFNELTIIAFEIKENIILFVYNTEID